MTTIQRQAERERERELDEYGIHTDPKPTSHAVRFLIDVYLSLSIQTQLQTVRLHYIVNVN